MTINSISGRFVRMRNSDVRHVITGEAFATGFTPRMIHTLCGRSLKDVADDNDPGPATCKRCTKALEKRQGSGINTVQPQVAPLPLTRT